MLLDIVHRAVAVGWVYDASQFLAGAPMVRRRLKPILGECRPGSRILDVGGGTGFLQKIVPPCTIYICLDLELPKLQRYVAKTNGAQPVQADATRLPVQTESIDFVTCIAMAHHLSIPALSCFLDESVRVLRRGGRFVLLDPVFATRRLPGRALWKLDRGAYPKTADTLRSLVSERFELLQWSCFAIYHAYTIGVGIKQ